MRSVQIPEILVELRIHGKTPERALLSPALLDVLHRIGFGPGVVVASPFQPGVAGIVCSEIILRLHGIPLHGVAGVGRPLPVRMGHVRELGETGLLWGSFRELLFLVVRKKRTPERTEAPP